MKLVHLRRFVLHMVVLATTNLAAFAQPASGLAAHWEGTIQMPERDVRINLDLAKNSKGAWTGSFTIPASDIIDAPLTGISVKDTSVRFGLGISNTSFDGTLSNDSSAEITGEYELPNLNLPLVFKRPAAATKRP